MANWEALESQPLPSLVSCDAAEKRISKISSAPARVALIVLEDYRFLLGKASRWEKELVEARKKLANLEAAR